MSECRKHFDANHFNTMGKCFSKFHLKSKGNLYLFFQALFKLSMPCAQTKQLVVVSPYKYPSKGKLHRACDKPNIRLLAVVISAPQNVKMRKMIRKTWGHVMKTSQSMSVVFFVGHSTDEGVNIAIIWENHRYNDIVTGGECVHFGKARKAFYPMGMKNRSMENLDGSLNMYH